MSADVLLPLVVFFALSIPTLVLLWRIFVVGSELRRDAMRGRTALDIARRTDVSLTELAAIVDDLRRRKAGPETGAASLRACSEALSRYALEADAVDRHASAVDFAVLRTEIERAQRAVELIEHGRVMMLERTGERVAEGETSVKRGYLNLLHARDSIKARAEEISAAAATPAGADARWRVRDH